MGNGNSPASMNSATCSAVTSNSIWVPHSWFRRAKSNRPGADRTRYGSQPYELGRSVERIRSPCSYIGPAKTRLCVRRFVEVVGDLEPQEVTRAHVMAYRDALEKLPGMRARNIAEHLGKLHVLFNVALSEGLLTANPAQGIKAREIDVKLAPRRQGFTSGQVREIFQALDGETEAFAWVVRLLAYHGMRSGEACQLRSDDVTILHWVQVLRIHSTRPPEKPCQRS